MRHPSSRKRCCGRCSPTAGPEHHPGRRSVVFDKTGLEGRYELTLTYNQNPSTASDPGGDTVSIFTALQEQLGLKLEPDRGPVRVLVVEHIDRPTPD